MKIKKFQDLLKEKKIDFALFYNLDGVSHDTDMFYFSNYKGVGSLILPRDKKPFLLVPEMGFVRAKKASKIKVYKWKKGKRLFEFLSILTRKNKIKTKVVGINKNVFTLNVYKSLKKYFKKIKTKDVSQLVSKAREIKSNEEIKLIKKACSINDTIFTSLIKNLRNKKLKKESEIVNFLKDEAKKNNSELAFSVVGSGKGGSIPHYEEKNIKLRKGFCILDFGVNYKGYNSDMTRTIYIGKPRKKDRELYDFMFNVQKDLIKNIKVGDNCGKIYNLALKKLGRYSKYFTHGLGHGIGLKVHELPNLSLDSKDKIINNMVFTIEPGIYFQNKFGIRIEDTVLMKDKPIRITKSTKDLLTIP